MSHGSTRRNSLPDAVEAEAIIRECYVDTHTRYVDAMLGREKAEASVGVKKAA